MTFECVVTTATGKIVIGCGIDTHSIIFLIFPDWFVMTKFERIEATNCIYESCGMTAFLLSIINMSSIMLD
jgi:hypothetical protein